MSNHTVPNKLTNKHRIKTSQNKDYDIYFTTEVDDKYCDILKAILGDRQHLIVSTPTVAEIYTNNLLDTIGADHESKNYMVLDCSEKSKSTEKVLQVCERAQEIQMDREGILVGIGGGVCTDIVTVAASWLRRGINYVRIPTTLVGQIDAAIGIKGGVNLNGMKNYLGCFHPPLAVLIAPFYLRTLPHQQLKSGLAEILKIAIVGEPCLFELIENHYCELIESGFTYPGKISGEVLLRSIDAMMNELEGNIFENQSYRRKVDFGHTISPALETACSYNLTHGEAVAVDIALCSVLAKHMGLLKSDICTRILSMLLDIGLPIWLPMLSLNLCQKALQEMSLHRGGKPNLVVPVEIGDVTFIEKLEDIPLDLLKNSICELKHIRA